MKNGFSASYLLGDATQLVPSCTGSSSSLFSSGFSSFQFVIVPPLFIHPPLSSCLSRKTHVTWYVDWQFEIFVIVDDIQNWVQWNWLHSDPSQKWEKYIRDEAFTYFSFFPSSHCHVLDLKKKRNDFFFGWREHFRMKSFDTFLIFSPPFLVCLLDPKKKLYIEENKYVYNIFKDKKGRLFVLPF